MRGRTLGDVFPLMADAEQRQRIFAELASRRPVHLETVGLRPDGSTVDVSLALTPHLGPLGELELVSTIARDITERVQALRRLDEERDAFLATLSHDLKNPLTAVLTQAQMIGRRVARGEAPDWVAPRLEQIEGNTRRIIAMLNELLDLAQLRTGRPLALNRQPTDLVALARTAAGQHQAATDRHRIEVRAEVAEVVGEWDLNRLARVLDNLIGNAVKYSPDGGAVVVEVGRDDATVRLAVRDSGIGIPAADLPTIFERFTRASNATTQPGTGLGLASVRHLVEAHGGEVSVESQEGVGTTVVVHLPLAVGALDRR
jgi:signal transduction histidine kinase